MSKYTYRIVTTPGIEHVLVRELKMLGLKNAHKVKGRKVVEASGSLKELYKIIFKTRTAENIQLRPTQSFIARGEKELDKNLSKVPWHAFLPLKNFKKYSFPYVNSKSFKSNLYHTKLVSDIVKLHINELPIKKEYKKQNLSMGYRSFRLKYKNKLRKEDSNQIAEFKENRPMNVNKKTIDSYRTRVLENLKKHDKLTKLGKINLIMNKNKAEVLLDTHYSSLYKHGYRASVQNPQAALVKGFSKSRIPGIIRETLAAASIIDSGIIERAHTTGKLYVWDPFCGSGTFLIELLQMFRGDPLKRDQMKFCFEHWPIFNREEFDQTRTEIFEQLMNYELDPAVDIRIIGSDIKVFKDHIEQAEIYKFRHHPNFNRESNFKDNPMLYSYHYPGLNRAHFQQIPDFVETNEKAVSVNRQNSLISQDPPFFSFYKGDFDTVAHQIIS